MDSSTNTQTSMTNFCTQCGSKIATGAKFCGVCGHLIDADSSHEKEALTRNETAGDRIAQGAVELSRYGTSQSVTIADDAKKHITRYRNAEERAISAWDSIRKNFVGALIYNCVLGVLYYLMVSDGGEAVRQNALSTAILLGVALIGPTELYFAILRRSPLFVIGVGCFSSLLTVFFYGLAPLLILGGALYVDSQIGFPVLTIALIVTPYAYLVYAISMSISARHHARKATKSLNQLER